jgi:hypothetical protein
MAAQVPNPSPKYRFMQDARGVTLHRDMIASVAFERGADFAMRQYASLLAQKTESADAAMLTGLKLRGAHEFLETLQMLAETPKMPAPVVMEGLDHSTR